MGNITQNRPHLPSVLTEQPSEQTDELENSFSSTIAPLSTFVKLLLIVLSNGGGARRRDQSPISWNELGSHRSALVFSTDDSNSFSSRDCAGRS
jgi:hypothetical protein